MSDPFFCTACRLRTETTGRRSRSVECCGPLLVLLSLQCCDGGTMLRVLVCDCSSQRMFLSRSPIVCNNWVQTGTAHASPNGWKDYKRQPYELFSGKHLNNKQDDREMSSFWYRDRDHSFRMFCRTFFFDFCTYFLGIYIFITSRICLLPDIYWAL